MNIQVNKIVVITKSPSSKFEGCFLDGFFSFIGVKKGQLETQILQILLKPRSLEYLLEVSLIFLRNKPQIIVFDLLIHNSDLIFGSLIYRLVLQCLQINPDPELLVRFAVDDGLHIQ